MSNKNNTKLKMFNSMFQVNISEGQYDKGHKKTSDETRKSIIAVVSELGKQIDDEKVFNSDKIISKYKSKDLNNKQVIDTVVEFMLDVTIADIKKAMKIQELIENSSNKLIMGSLFDTVLESAIEKVFDRGLEDNQEAMMEVVLNEVFEAIKGNESYYKVAPAEIFLGPIVDPGSKFILDFNSKELMRYLKVNYYVDFSKSA